jgi:hypothetical protein
MTPDQQSARARRTAPVLHGLTRDPKRKQEKQ